MKQIKIRGDFFQDILEGKKKYEFIKLEKGITTGTYEFVSIEKGYFRSGYDGDDFHCNFCKEIMVKCECDKKPKYIWGTAHLKPLGINPIILFRRDDKLVEHTKERFEPTLKRVPYFWSEDCLNIVDKETYNFVKENYIDKDIDFVVYEISDVKVDE